ncbi:unnamed protein product [Blepharisma stoltei]|uniref:Uncharacterized protein n=1 Tax=Blepharisma stoltei TaxID=1481888 RepID=A0AAU9IIB9_9CILI|nr:unnamed protein product [Blepharisma stoltei]
MRPTNLGFRSPKERTPEFYDPIVTFDGRSLSSSPGKLRPSFSKSRRFAQYDDEAKKTGFRVGPGSYSQQQKSIAAERIKGTPLYCKFHGNKDTSNNGYYMVGNHLVYDASFVLKARKPSISEAISRVDPSQVLSNSFTRPTTASNDKFSPKQTQGSPWFMKIDGSPRTIKTEGSPYSIKRPTSGRRHKKSPYEN